MAGMSGEGGGDSARSPSRRLRKTRCSVNHAAAARIRKTETPTDTPMMRGMREELWLWVDWDSERARAGLVEEEVVVVVERGD